MQDLKKAFSIPELSKKIWFTLLIITIFMVLTIVPIPGVNKVEYINIVKSWGDMGNLLNIVSGKALFNASFISLGLYPFIIGSIISQILTIAVPKLRNIAQLGEAGTKTIAKITRYVALGTSLIFGILLGIGTRGAISTNINFYVGLALVIVSTTAGAALMEWFCELLNTKGLGNGMSIILFAAIARNIPHIFKSLYLKADKKFGMPGAIGFTVLGAVIAIAVIVLLIYVMSAERKIKFLFSKRTIGMKQFQGQNQTLPVKITQAGIMPIIYTMAIMAFPSLIVTMLTTGVNNAFVKDIRNFTYSPSYFIIFLFVIVAFTFFFSLIQFNPVEISNELKRNGGYIAGVKPGAATTTYLFKLYNSLNYADAFVLLITCCIPMLLSLIPGIHNIWYAGIVLFMITGALVETIALIENEIKKHEEGQKQTKKYKNGKPLF